MKIGILTQPLYCNYGGLVQCYALQQTLKGLGHETVVLQREFDRKYTLQGACSYYAKLIAKKLLGRQVSWHYYVDQQKRAYQPSFCTMLHHRTIEKRDGPIGTGCNNCGQRSGLET